MSLFTVFHKMITYNTGINSSIAVNINITSREFSQCSFFIRILREIDM